MRFDNSLVMQGTQPQPAIARFGMAPLYIAIEGVIGVGKTTLARLLQPDYGADLVLEMFEENPFLPLFYQDAERYAFQTQIVFLLSRYQQQRDLMERIGRQALISDYLFDKDRLFAQLVLEGDEWATYVRLHEALAAQITPPMLVIYLRASVETLMARIAQRDRSYERSMSSDYIRRLATSYDRFFKSYRDAPLIVVETDELNVLTRDADLARIRAQIATVLAGGIPQIQARPASRENGAVGPQQRVSPPAASDPLRAYLQFQAEAGALAELLMRSEREGTELPAALTRTYARLDDLARATSQRPSPPS